MSTPSCTSRSESMKLSPLLTISKEESKEESKEVKSDKLVTAVAKSSLKEYVCAITDLSSFFLDKIKCYLPFREELFENAKLRDEQLKLFISEIKLLNEEEKLIPQEQINSGKRINIDSELLEFLKILRNPIYSKLVQINELYEILLTDLIYLSKGNSNFCLENSKYETTFIDIKIQRESFFPDLDGNLLVKFGHLEPIIWKLKEFEDVSINLFNEKIITFERIKNKKFCKFLAQQCKSDATYFLNLYDEKFIKIGFNDNLRFIFKDNIEFFNEFLQLATDEGQGALFAYNEWRISLLMEVLKELNFPTSVVHEVIIPYIDVNE